MGQNKHSDEFLLKQEFKKFLNDVYYKTDNKDMFFYEDDYDEMQNDRVWNTDLRVLVVMKKLRNNFAYIKEQNKLNGSYN